MTDHMLKEMKLSPGDGYATFTTYGTSPENPSRTLIAYTLFPNVPQNGLKAWDAEIWLCGINGENHRKLCDVYSIDAHNGARFDWIDDETLFYFYNGSGKGQVRVIRTDGTVLHTKPGYPGERLYGDKALLFQIKRTGPEDGIHSLDVRTGESTQLLSFDDLAAFAEAMAGDDDPSMWKISHPRYSLDGEKVAFNVNNKRRTFLFSMNADGSGLRLFGFQPLHWLWYKDQTIVGQDGKVNDGKPDDRTGRRWDLHGRWIEDVSGIGNHLAVSPDGEWFASDNKYFEVPVVLKVYRKGDLKGTQIFSSEYASAVWENGVAHINPSFARNNSRLYYPKPAGPNLVHAYYAELPSTDTDVRNP